MKKVLTGSGTGYTLTDLTSRQVVTFDSNGNAVGVADRNRNAVTISYSNGQPASVISPAGPIAARTASLSYSSSTYTLTVGQSSGSLSRSVKYVKNSPSNLTSMVDATGKTTGFGHANGFLSSITATTGAVTNFSYDSRGRVSQIGGGTIGYGYDKASNLISTTDTRGTTTNTFDASGVVTKMTYPKGAGTKVLAFATDDQGRRTDAWMQTNTDNTYWEAHTHTVYDTSGRASEVIGQLGPSNTSNTPILDTSYCYNSATAAPACGTGAATDHHKLQWSKDNLTGLVTAYSYDAAGRVAQVAQTGTGANTYAYTYDANGNRLTATVTGATPSTQTVTANPGNQISSTGYGFDGAGNMTTDYATTSFAYTYDPYGVPTLTSGTGNGPVQNPYLFKGGIQDRTTGWVHYGARWYNPATGTWTQQDTLDTPLNPANANRYAYAADDPINNLDPSGTSTDAALCLGTVLTYASAALLAAAAAPESGGLSLCVTGTILAGLGRAALVEDACGLN